MSETDRMGFPYIAASQAQKHVTHNEALRLIDGLLHLTVVNRTRTSPPASPAAGACYIVAAGATGEWAGWDGDVALRSDGAWYRLPAREGIIARDTGAGEVLMRSGGAWVQLGEAAGLVSTAPAVPISIGALGASTNLAVLDEELTLSSGPTVQSSLSIPNRAIVLGVTVKVKQAVQGAASFDLGTSTEPDKFGGSLGVSAGSTNIGVISPQAFYAATPLLVSANGGDFAGGRISIAIHVLQLDLPD